MKTNEKIRSKFWGLAALALLAPACGATADEGAAVGSRGQAVTTASTTEVVLSIQDAARQLQAAMDNLNNVIAGAYSVWPTKAEFQRANTIRGYRNDLEALNAAAFVSAAYAAGNYDTPSLNWVERQQLGGAYANQIGAGGAYVLGGSFAGAYITPVGAVAGAYVSGVKMNSISEKINRLNRE